jgi:hypothetical protein
VVKVDPFKPTLKAPASKSLKLEYDKLLSHVAFRFNLRRYTLACREPVILHSVPLLAVGRLADIARHVIGCQLIQ